MTVTTTPLAAGIENADSRFGAFLDQLSDRINSGEKLLADGVAFEKALLKELKQASETSHLSLPATDLAPGEAPSAPPFEPRDAGAIGLLDGGLSQQNGAVYTKAGEMTSTASAVGNSALAPASDGTDAEHHFRVDFRGNIYNALNADMHDRSGQALPFSDGAKTPWTMEANNPFAGDVTSNPASDASHFDLPMDHVFYNGEGRPISLASLDNTDISLATDGDKIILPDGVVFDYDPWQASIEGMNDPWDDTRSFDGLDTVGASIIIEGELV